MAYVNVYCKNCGNSLGRRTVPVLGIDPNCMGNKGKTYDPDCSSCNPFYNDKCAKCGDKYLPSTGICNVCKTDNGKLATVASKL